MDDARRKEALLLLGLADPVTKHQVTRAYREVSKRVHPDAADSAQADPARFAAIHDAYEFLLNTLPLPTSPPPTSQVGVFAGGAPSRPGTWIIVGPAWVQAGRARRRP